VHIHCQHIQLAAMSKRSADTPAEELQQHDAVAPLSAASTRAADLIAADSPAVIVIVTAPHAASWRHVEPLAEQQLDAKRARPSLSYQLLDCFALLSSVEVALVLQPLDNTSRLAAAATCRCMLSDALQPLAWKHAEPLRITDDQLLVQQGEQHAAHSLLALAPVHLLMHSRNADSFSLQLSCIHHLERLEQRWNHVVDITPLLLQPTVAHRLRQLKLTCSVRNNNREHIGRISALTQLVSLDISIDGTVVEPYVQQLSTALAQLLAQPQLTELVLRGFHITLGDDDALLHSLLTSVGYLRRLHLNCTFFCRGPISAAVLQQFQSLGAALPQLEVLSLAGLDPRILPLDSLHNLFSSLRALHTLQLLYCVVNDLLPLIPSISTLRKLLLFKIDDDARTLCSVSALSTLQAAMPHLHITNGVWNNWGDAVQGSAQDTHTDRMLLLDPNDSA